MRSSLPIWIIDLIESPGLVKRRRRRVVIFMHERQKTIDVFAMRRAASGIGIRWYGLLSLCVLAQIVTLTLTWQLWQVRETPLNLPLLEGPWISFGTLMLFSLFYVLIDPRRGAVVHLVVLFLACIADQYRIQPQFISIAILIFGCSSSERRMACRWYLIALWFWAGVHKIFSPEWPMITLSLLGQANLLADPIAPFFSWLIAFGEISVAILALLRPRAGAIGCILLHVGIGLFMSPLFFDFNASVIPWNLATAVVGCAMFWNATQITPATRWGQAIAAVCLLLPFGFYGGWVDRGLAFVLYSGNMPRAAMTGKDGRKILSDWDKLGVPFPGEQRHFRTIFSKIGESGDKLHIFDRRPWSRDRFFLVGPDQTLIEISRSEFSRNTATAVKGVFLDDPLSIFTLQRNGATMLTRVKGGPIYAIEFSPEKYDPAVLRHLQGLPNLEQIQLAGCAVVDQDLRHLAELDALVGIGLSHTSISDRGLLYLAQLRNLRVIEHQGSRITPLGLEQTLGLAPKQHQQQ